MEKDIKIRKFNIGDLKKVNEIYVESFQKEERFSILILLFNILLKRSKMYILENCENIVAFIYIINYRKMSFILYLAVNKKYRGKGYGTCLLNEVLKLYKENTIYLNIDEINKKYADIEIRKKRLSFYLKNNFHLTNYLSIEKNCNANILSSCESFNLNEYIKLDKKIGSCFFCGKSNITKIINT